MDYKKLLEERASVANEMNNLTAEVKRDNRSFSAEELEKFDKMDADFKSLSEKIETCKRMERVSELAPARDVSGNVQRNQYKPEKTITREDQDMAFKAWALKAGGKETSITREHTEAAQKCGVNLHNDSFNVKLSARPQEIERNQSSGINSEGGYLQNDGLFQGLERNLKFYGGARACAKVIRSDKGEPLSWSYSDDTTNVGYRAGQNSTVVNTNVVYNKKTIGVYEYLTSVYPVSLQLLQDAQIDVSSDVGEVLGQRLGRVTNADYTNGTGAAMPFGFMTEASAGVTAAGAAIAYTDLVKLKFSFDPIYMEDPSFTFTMHSQTLSALWQLEDVNGRPLFWNQMKSLADGNPLMILDKPIVLNNDMPQVATGKSPIAGIIPSKFIIRDVKEAQILVLKERFLDQLAIGFIGWLRTDCKLLNTNCCKKLTMP